MELKIDLWYSLDMLKKVIIGVVLNCLALYAVVKLMGDITYTGGWKFFVLTGVIIGVLNIFVKPLMKILSLPVLFLTFGLFSLVINAVIFWLTVKIVNGIALQGVTVAVGGIWTYFIAALIFGIVNTILHVLVPNKH